jgi:two-component system, NtrC family, sensor kinase
MAKRGQMARKPPTTHKRATARKRSAAPLDLKKEIANLRRELVEARQQQVATADVLKVISRSTFDLQTVLVALLESAVRLCDADSAHIFLGDADAFRLAACSGFSREYEKLMRQTAITANRGSLVGRTVYEGRIVHIHDVLTDTEYTLHEAQNLGRFRTMLGIPMLRDGVTTGVLSMTRTEARPFTDKQVELVTTFADQAMIAIENARLFEQVQAKTRDLTEALTYQTGSGNILKVIASSPTDVGPVLKAIVESACELCEAYDAVVLLKDGGDLRFSAHYGPIGINLEAWPISRNWTAGRAFVDRRPVHVRDMLSDEGAEFPDSRELSRHTGSPSIRSILSVPLLRENESIGTILLRRTEVQPFTDKQISLLETFADQAVIAIGNVQMFEQVQERTKELSFSLDELRTAQDRLIQTEKLASLGQLTAGIAHEIKNPLNFVNNFSALSVELVDELDDVLKPATLDNKTREETSELMQMLKGNLEKVVQHGQRADSIVKNMLLHSREGSGERRPVDLNAIVEDSLNLAYHGARAEKKEFNIRLERSFDPAAGMVDLFPQEITRVLLNLISNGVYAAMKRKAEMRDGYEPTLAAATGDLGDRVEIRIRDNGGGIPPEVREKIFNPFFTTKPPGEGTGLGLSLSYDIIVKQHSGSIEVDTQPGEFTEFRVILPRKAALSKPE